MNKVLLCLVMAILSFVLVVGEVSAKRFGGGRSFGVQRSHSSLFSSFPKKSNPNFAQQQTKNRWGGFLGGLIAGGLLASLFMQHGLGAGLFSWLLIGLVVFFVLHFLRRKTTPAYYQGFTEQKAEKPFGSDAFRPYAANNNFARDMPQFDESSFLREAKVTFYRLQKAFDQKNIQDLQAFTTPEVFAEIKMQIEERGDRANHTEVVNLDTELLNIEDQVKSRIASVRFSGFIKEDEAPMVAFEEIWHFNQFAGASSWLVSGIQQESLEP